VGHPQPLLSLPEGCANRLCCVVSDFLLRGWLERLAFEEIHSLVSEGGLHLSAISAREKALLVKQACHRLASGVNPAAHIAYWVGHRPLGRPSPIG
jgi:hypothetical protein